MHLMRLVAALLVSALATPAFGQATAPMTTEARNKATATRVFEEIFNQGKFQVADEIYAPGFKNHGLHKAYDLKADQDAVHAEKQAFPDLHMSVDKLVAEGDLVTALWTFRGTHTAGGYGGLPPTGCRVEMRGMTIWRIVDGRIQEEWSVFDELGPYSQIAAQLKRPLLGILTVLLALVVLVERTILLLIRLAYRAIKPSRLPS
jgi:predicted ester cyclase